MAVIVNGRQFLDADDVSRNPALALAEANKQLAFAAAERLRRESEVRVDIDGNPDPNGGFINAGLEADLTTSIASQLPAVVVGSTAGVVSRSGFIIDPSWPIDIGTPNSPPIVQPPEVSLPPPNPPAFNPENGTRTETEETVTGGGQDTDTFTPPSSPEVTNTPLSVDEVNRRNDNEPAGNLNADQTDGDDDGGNDDNDSPEPPASAQIAGPDGLDDGGEDSIVTAPRDSSNTVVADGAVQRAAANDPQSGLSTGNKKIEISPRPNQISSFASHTYNIALYMMSPKEYVKMLKAPASVRQIPKQLIARSGGVGNDGGENFDIDFFIDNLQMTNIGVSPNTRTTNTNAVDVSFDITEPMGVTLIERLKNEAKNSLEEAENYIKTPYLLEITFKGYDDNGHEMSGAFKPKYIPIKIQGLTFRIESTGTVYKAKAVPFHQDVFSSLNSTIPINIQVSAGTVNDIFGGTAQQVNYETETINDEELAQDIGTTIKKTTLGEPASTLASAVNNFLIAQTKPTVDKNDPGKKVPASSQIADKWSFAIAPEIKNAKLVGSKFDALNTPQKTNKLYKQASAGLAGKVNLDSTTNMFKINAGTNIVSLINYIIVASDYIDANVDEINKIGTDEPPENKKISWYKVIPQIVGFQGWDKKAGRYKFHIQWTITIEDIFYSDFPWAPKTKPTGEGVHKIYDYIFSGNNTEVTDLTLQLDSAYYQAHTIGTGIPDGDKDKSNIAPQVKPLPQSVQGQGVINDETITKKRSKDLMSNIMFKGSDMIQIDMAILGDPAFLPVGDAFFQPQGNRGAIYTEAFLPDGTINYDLTPPYIQLNLKTPTDYDDFTGLVDLSGQGKYTSSEFSGVYRVVQTNSTFSGGQFTQRLDAIREKMQPINGKIGRSVQSIQEREQKAALTNNLVDSFFASLVSGVNPLESLISQGTASLSTFGESLVTGFQAGRIQRLADETDQGRFEEGIGDEEPPVDIPDNNNVVSVDQFTELLKD